MSVTPATQKSTYPESGGNTPAVRLQLQRILASSGFANAERMSRFLRFTVEHTLQNRAGELKEYLIGVEVFDRSGSYDPRLDPVVRVEARRLRTKLASYYKTDGKDDAVLIEFPKGTYVPVFREREAPSAAPDVQPASTIAVLPFANLSPDAENEYFSDGLTQELIHLLTKVEGLRVVAWNSSSQLKGKTPDPYSVGQQLKVGTVLTGSVRGASECLRITAQLVDTSNGYYLWSETYDRRMEDVFAIQEEISSAIVKTLKKRLTVPDAVASRASSCLEAYNLYLKGRFHWNKRTAAGMNRSVQFFTDAIERDATYAAAYSGLADSYTLLADYGLAHPSDVMPKAKAAASKALELDPQLGEAEASLGLIQGLYEWDWEQAERHYQRAIELNPGYATAHFWYAVDHLAMLGRFEEAHRMAENAQGLDPLSPIIREAFGFINLLERKYDSAIVHYREELELDPYFYKGHTSLGRAFIQKGMYHEAIGHLEKGRLLAGDLPNILGALGQAWALAGNAEEARRLLKALKELSLTSYVPCTGAALVHLGLGESEKALEMLERGCDERHLMMSTLNVHPAYDPLRNEPRFKAILKRMRLMS